MAVKLALSSSAGTDLSTLLSSVHLVNTTPDPDEELLITPVTSTTASETLVFDLSADPLEMTAEQTIHLEAQVNVHPSAPQGTFTLEFDTEMNANSYVVVDDGGTPLQGIETDGICADTSGTCAIDATLTAVPTWSIVVQP